MVRAPDETLTEAREREPFRAVPSGAGLGKCFTLGSLVEFLFGKFGGAPNCFSWDPISPRIGHGQKKATKQTNQTNINQNKTTKQSRTQHNNNPRKSNQTKPTTPPERNRRKQRKNDNNSLEVGQLLARREAQLVPGGRVDFATAAPRHDARGATPGARGSPGPGAVRCLDFRWLIFFCFFLLKGLFSFSFFFRTSICLRIDFPYFPLLVLKGVCHCWKYFCFSRGLNQMEVDYDQIGGKTSSLMMKVPTGCEGVQVSRDARCLVAWFWLRALSVLLGCVFCDSFLEVSLEVGSAVVRVGLLSFRLVRFQPWPPVTSRVSSRGLAIVALASV